MYNQKVLEIFKNPLNAGGLQGANGVAKVASEKYGDVVRIYLKVDENQVIENARFKAMGGVVTIVACNILCDLIKGKTLEGASAVTVEDIVEITDLNNRTIQYVVYDKYVVREDDRTCSSQKTDGRKEVTLITCTDDSENRVVVKATEKTS